MATISSILNEVVHRPYPLPEGPWWYYQEWNNALFLHFKVPYDSLRALVPAHLNIDMHQGDCYVSLVPFTMEKIRPRFLPAVDFISNFHEINLRTYVVHNNKQGVYFLNIEAAKSVSVWIARILSGLPYEKASIKRMGGIYQSVNSPKQFALQADYSVQEPLHEKSTLDKWLTERYCLYLEENSRCYRYDIHHKPWEIYNVQINQLKTTYHIDNLDLNAKQPDLVHYSKGVQVLAWARVML